MGMLIEVCQKMAPFVFKKIEDAGALEIVTRLADGKIAAMTKVPVRMLKDNNKVLSLLRIASLDTVAPNSVIRLLKATAGINAVQGITNLVTSSITIRDVNKVLSNLDIIGTTVLSKLDAVGASLSSIQKLTFLNGGIGFVNLGIGIIGIKYIGDKLNNAINQLNNISDQVAQIKDMLTIGKLQEYHNLCLRFGTITDNLAHGDNMDCDKISDLLNDMCSFATWMIQLYLRNSKDKGFADIALDVMFNLLAAYSVLLDIYIREYYFERNCLPGNLDNYTGLYDRLLSQDFSKKVQDHLVLTKGMTITDAITAIQVQKLYIANCVVQYNDQIDILKIVETKDAYLSLMKATDKYVESEIERLIPEVEEKAGIENCREVVHEALKVQLAV